MKPFADRLIYVVRRTSNWLDVILRKTDNIEPQRSGIFTHLTINTWNATFKTPYVEARIFLNNLREENLKNTKFEQKYNFFSPKFLTLCNIPSLFIFPTDDDDWFHDDILDIFLDNYTEYTNYYWNYCLYDNNVIRINPEDTWPGWTYLTNNYVVKTPCDPGVVDGHGTAQEKLKNRGDIYIPETMSVHNRSIVSLSNNYEYYFSKEDLIQSWEIQQTLSPELDCVPIVFHKYIGRMIEYVAKFQLKPNKLFL